MANVLNRITGEYLKSVNTPDYSTTDWIINPDLSRVVGVPVRYWKITEDLVSEMSETEKQDVDAKLELSRINSISIREGDTFQISFTDSRDKIQNTWLPLESNNSNSNRSPAIISWESKLVSIQFTNSKTDIDVDIQLHGIADSVYNTKVTRNITSRIYSEPNVNDVITFKNGELLALFLKNNSQSVFPGNVIVKFIFQIIKIDSKPITVNSNLIFTPN